MEGKSINRYRSFCNSLNNRVKKYFNVITSQYYCLLEKFMQKAAGYYK